MERRWRGLLAQGGGVLFVPVGGDGVVVPAVGKGDVMNDASAATRGASAETEGL